MSGKMPVDSVGLFTHLCSSSIRLVMFQVIWELKVKFKEREKFEKFYDAKGEWVRFFSKSPAYQGTDVLESGEGDGTFLVIDEWQSEEDFNEYTSANKPAYNQLEEMARQVSRKRERIWVSLNPEEE
jgi:heme-degrading monooxygenase HmoA